MKKLAIVLVGAGFVTFVHANAEAACGTLKTSKGDIKIQSGQTKQVSPAPEGSKVCSGDTVIAGKDSRTKIVMEDGNELNISPDSKIVLEQYEFKPADNKKKVLLNVLQGKVRAATKQENMYNDTAKDGQANTFQVKTKSAVAGVRGTDFMTGYNPANNKSEVVTFRGKVEVGQLGPSGQIMNSVQVAAGQKTETLPGQPPAPPKPVPPTEMKQLDIESKADAPTGPSATAPTGSGDKKKDEKKDESKSAETKQGEQPKQEAAGDKKQGEGPKSENAGNAGNSPATSAGSNGDSGGSSNNGNRQPASSGGTAGGAASGSARSGANMGGGSLIDSSDLRGAPQFQAGVGGAGLGGTGLSGGLGSGIGSGLAGGALPPIAAPPPILAPPTLPKCDFCNQAIQNGPSKVKVIITYPSN